MTKTEGKTNDRKTNWVILCPSSEAGDIQPPVNLASCWRVSLAGFDGLVERRPRSGLAAFPLAGSTISGLSVMIGCRWLPVMTNRPPRRRRPSPSVFLDSDILRLGHFSCNFWSCLFIPAPAHLLPPNDRHQVEIWS